MKHGGRFEEVDGGRVRTAPCREGSLASMPLRWHPVPLPSGARTDFLAGLRTIATGGDAAMHAGMASHVYVADASMERRYLQDSDGELLVVPQLGRLRFVTEFGIIVAGPGEIVVVPRGVRFRVELVDGPIRGYICENYGATLALPERGPIGANSLADERDFLYPAAAYEDLEAGCELYLKSRGRMFRAELARSPLDVVAWHGNCAPCKYDLGRFAPIGSIGFDHPDPSIFTVLSAASDTPGAANVDFVIFPERWLVMEDSFRPPWYHRNVMSEFMGLVHGVYDARPGGFVPGGMSLHNAMVAHGPDPEAFERASTKPLEPEKLTGTLAFMFETRYALEPTAYASSLDRIDTGYAESWNALEPGFRAPSGRN